MVGTTPLSLYVSGSDRYGNSITLRDFDPLTDIMSGTEERESNSGKPPAQALTLFNVQAHAYKVLDFLSDCS